MSFRSAGEEVDKGSYAYLHRLLWCAPELLRMRYCSASSSPNVAAASVHSGGSGGGETVITRTTNVCNGHAASSVVATNSAGDHHHAEAAPAAPVDGASKAFGPAAFQKADVYSFGIVLHEIVGRNAPWGARNITQAQVIGMQIL